MRRVALAVFAAGLLFTASRSEAQTSYLLDAFTFNPRTGLLVGTIGDCLGDVCQRVQLTATASTVLLPQDPLLPPTFADDPFYGLFTAWNALLSPTTPYWHKEPSYALLAVMGLSGVRAIATTEEGVTSLTNLRPVGTNWCSSSLECGVDERCIGGFCQYVQCTTDADCPQAEGWCSAEGFCRSGGGSGKGGGGGDL